MKKNRLVTIIVPVYNVEKYLNNCINSLINQTYKNIEIILVDDGSQDNCPKICDDWATKDKRIKVIHKKNAGLGYARNTGLDNATGDYVCFVDSDDFVDLDMLENALDSKYDLVYFGYKNVSLDNSVIDRKIPSPPQQVFKGKDIVTKFVPNFITSIPGEDNYNLNASSCMCIISKKIIDDNNWRFVSEREIISEDIYSMLILFKHIKSIKVIEKDFYSYRITPQSLTRTYRKDRFSKYKELYFHLKTIYGENDLINIRLKYMFISYTIAALKQLVSSNLSFKTKKELFYEIASDEEVQKVGKEIIKIDSFKRKMFLYLVLKKRIYGAYILTILQNIKKGY